MAGENNQNNQNEDLNDAVEQTDTNDAGTPSQQQNQQNQQNTIASTVATGAENTDAADEINQALEDNPSGAGNAEDASASGAAVQEDTTESGSDSDAAQSNVVDGAATETGTDGATAGSGGSGAGAQAVGGGESTSSDGGTDAEGNEGQGQAATTSASLNADSSDSGEQQANDDLDSQTIEETFAVDVQASDEESISEVEDDFDSETVSETFKIQVESENDAPEVEQDLAYIMDEDGSITFTQEQLLEYASDVDGDELVASNVQVGADATVQDNGDGTFTVVPSADFNGELDLTFDISDGQDTVSSAIDLTVRPINDAPVPEDKTFEIEEDGTLIFTDADLLTGATDIEGDNLTVEGVTYDGGDGILTDNDNGTYTFAPNENFNGDVNFSFDVSDGTDTVSANIDVSVAAVDDAPVSGDLAYSVDEDGSIRLSQEQLLSQASDVEGDDLTASGLTVGGDATVTQNDDGSFTITPDENFNGDIDINFDISDGTNTVQASADLTVNPVNDLPVPQDQQFSIAEDGTLQFTDSDLLTGATDIEGDDLTVEGISYEGTDGVLTDHGDGSYSFAPNENFNGEVNFSFDVSDGTDTVSANIDVSVTPENDPPVAGSTSYTVNEDNSITISDAQLLATSSDIEGDVSIDSVTYSGSDGVLEINGNGTYTFSPNENFSGEIALDVVVTDEEGATDATTAGITVLEVNDPPVAGPTSYTIDEDSVLTFNESQVLLNASDVEGDVELVGISYDGPDGIFSVNGDGTCSYAPNENFNGQVQLGVTIRDEDGAEVDTVINVDVLPINDAPVSGDLAYNVNEDGSITLSQEQLLSQASDVEGQDLTASDLTVDGNATVTANDDGSFTIVPEANFNGDIDIQFNITDGTDTVQATADLTVNPVNDLPVPQDQQFSIEEDGTLQFTDADLLTGATDIDGDNLTVEGISYTGGDGVLTDHGDGTYTFAPNENFNGDVNFSFDVSDGTETVSANIDVTVTPENDPPVAGSTSYMVNEDNAITISDEQLLANSSDVEGAVSVDSVTYSGTDGVFQDNGDGSYTFLPNENFSGDISLDLIVADEDGSIDETTAGITVLEVNDPPVAGPTSYTIDEDSVLTFSESQILVNASDVEGDVELVGINYDGSDGIFTVNGDGTCSFAPNENFNGQVQLGVTIQDEDGATVETQINVDVLPINDAPVSGDLAYTINEDSSITLSQEQLLARAGDIDSENLEAINLSNDENATIQQNDDGSYTITPDADYNGDLDLNFDIIDNDGGSVQVGLDITVNPLNDLPQAQDQQFSIEEDGTLLFTDADLLAGASDIDGDELSIENVLYTGADGVLSDNGDGTYSFAPNENFNGEVQFSFDVFDGTGSTAAVIDVSVTPENDPPVAGSTSYTVQEDGQITISDEQLLANSSDVEGDVALSSVTYAGDDGSFVDNGNGTYTFTPNENFDGDISLDVVVVDEAGATATTTAGIDVIAVNDGPETSDIQAEVDEDNSITITQEQLLANATDVEGDELTASNLQTNDPDATIVTNDDGSFTITHTENFNGELDFTYSISDGDNEVLTTLDLTVNPVNDAPEAGEEIFIQAQEDQTVGVTLREEPALRLDQAPENGIIEANLDNEWVVLEVGQEVPADTEVRFVPSEGALAEGTHTTQIGTFDDNASVDDWGTEVDPYTREFSDGDLTVTVQSNDDPLGAWNGNTHIGHGLGDTDRQGLSGDEKLTVSVEGQDINEISFHLDGLGGWFMEESRHFTEVEIKAFNEDGDLIDSMTYHKEDRGGYETDYTLTVSEPVSYFELGTVQGNGTYVVQNMTVSQTAHDEAVFTSIGVDGSEITETIELNIHAGDNEIELTADLPNITIDTEGSAQFASVVITEEQLLAQASDIDGDDLDIQNLELVGENSEHATLTDNGDGTWTVTPDENFHGEIELDYQVTDGELTDSNIININFESVNDAPIVSGPIVLSTDEDEGITFSADDLLANTTDIEGDTLSISDITYGGDHGDLVDNGDGTFTFMPNENFNGEIDIDYKVFDGTDEVATHLDLTVIPVNDIPVPGEPLHTQMLENGSMIIEAKDLLSGATDVDGDILHVENLLLADQTQGTLTDNGDNTFTFEPAENFSGEVNLTFDISDGQASAPSIATVDVEIVNEGPEVSGPIEAAVDEDGSITITQEDLLANATDVDGDNLEAVNFATNDPNAVIVENSDGSFTITPSADFFGEIEFTYDVTDAIETVAADLNLIVNPINDAPDVPDMSFTTEDGQAITITEAELLAQATDVEGDELSVVNVTSASDTVEVTDNGDGTYTLTPEQGFFGNVDLTFDVSDGTDVVAANIDLKVEFVNDTPEATPMVADVDEDGSILVTQEMLLESASDQDGDELFASALETNDPNASIVDNGDGTYTVTPSENFNGDIAFTYEVSDGELSTSNDMTLTVNPVNDIPIVAPGMYHIEEDGSILFTQEDLLSGAIDIDGDDLSVTSINYSGDEGTVTDNGDGTFSFVPEEHFSGDLQFSFTVTDGTTEVEQDLNVHIEAVADAPDLVITDGDGVNVDDEAILVEPGGIVELNIAAALVDQDLSETLTVTVDGVPEGSVIQYDNEGVLNDQDNGITSYNDTEITVTFEGETAGYQNTAGYYKVDEDGNITGVEVVYENASQVDGGGDLVPGQDQFSFQVEEGESFNLFLIPNGHQHNDFDAMQDGQYEFRAADGSPANMDTVDRQLVFVAADGTETVVQGQNGDAIFHGGSSSQLNQDGIEHTRTTVNEDGELVYGFEDLYGGGDADYTDFNFTIDVGEVNSQIYSGEVTVGPDGTVNLPTTAIENALQIQLPEDFNEQLEVHVTATATELSNDDSETVSQTIYINATGAHIEHAPEALPVAATVEEDGSIIITQEDLLANARDLDGDQLTALNLATDDESVTITDNGDGTYTLTPDADFNGDVNFTFDVSDGDDVVSTNLELTVSPVNDGPEAQDQAFTVGEDGVLTFNDQDLLTGATDIEGDDLSVEGVTYTGADGVLTDNGDGTYSFAPNENFNGDVNFSFNVSDGTDTVTANIDVSVTPENDPPVAGSTSYTVHEDNSITISNEQLLANSSDIEGEVAIDSVTYSGSDGVLEINGDGTYTFSPNENFNGEVSLDVVVVDEDDAAVSTTAGITVLEVNDPPVAGPTSYTVDEDSVLTFNETQVLLNASDIEGDVQLVEINYDGPDGIFSINGDGTCSFAPNENFNGQVQLDVTIQDEDGAQVDTHITVDVLPINDVPVSGDLAYSVEEDGSITLSQEQLLSQANDVDGDDLTASNLMVDGDATVTANDDGSFTITPDANFNGDIDLTFDINDGVDTLVATADLTVNPVNDLPQPQDQAFSIGEDGVLNFTDEDLLTDATDIDGDDLSVEGVTYTGADGVLTDNGDGSYSFAPNENFNGDVNFSFDVSDGTDTVQANIDVSVTPENDPPVAGSTSYTVHEDNSITISDEQLLANSSDIEGEVAIDSVAYTGADGVLEDNGNGTYTFSPNENFNGEVSLDVVVTDEEGATEATTAGISVLEVNDPPVAGSTSYTVHEDNSITISNEQLLANSSDIEGEFAIDSVAYSGADGVFEDNGNGTYTFSPNENFNGEVSLDVVVTDEEGATEATTAGVTVLEVNDPPVAGSTSYSVNEDEVITISAEQLLANASDIEGEVAIDSVNYTGADGIFTDNGNGTFSFAPNANFDGDVSLDVEVTDEDGATVATSASIDVLPINDPPVSGDLAYSIDEDGSIILNQEQLLSQASDVDGDELTASNLSAGDNATVVDNGDGTFTVTPDANFNGDIDLSFDISDGTESIVANADLTVNPVNDLPTTSDVYANVDEDNVITITQEQLLANAADIEGGDLVASDLTLVGDDATIVNNGDGTFSITPSENFNGYIDVAYSISDGDTPIAANLGLTVDPVNDAPIVSADVAITIEEDGSYTITQEELLQFATDIEDDDMTAIIGEQGDETTVTGTVLDAETGSPVVGADVTMTDNAGHSYTTVTDQFGHYSVSGPVVDQGTVTIEQEGSITSSFLIPAGEDTNGGVTAISEVLEETDMRIVVTWGESPRDMDNHLWLYDTENGNELDHIYYRDMSHDLGEGNVVQQDVDDTNGGGPETITIPNYQDADMHYSVHNYTNRSWDVDGVEDVQVQVFVGDTLVETFTPDLPDNPTGEHWHVFDIVNGVVVPSQDVGSENAFDLPTAEEALANENGINISELLTGDEDGDSGETGGNEPSVGDVSIENALITDNGDGTYTITPEENFNGEFSISYNVDDGNGGVTPAELDVTVTAVNDLSVIYDHDYTINEDGSLIFTDEQLLAGATDIDGENLSVESVNYEGTDGVFTDNGDGTYTFAPNENFNGNVDLTYDVSDGTDVVSANIDVQVVPINDVPVAGTTAYSVEEDGSITLSDTQLLANSSDVEGEVFVSDVSYSGTDGVFTDNGDGTYTFAPNENFNGDISLDVSVMDEDGATAETTAGIDVIAVNDLPVAGSTTYSVDEDNVITISEAQLIANSSDIEGDVSVSDVSYSGADGIFTDNGDGTYSFAANENFNGNINLDVTVIDDDGATAQTTAGIDVIAVNDAPVSGDLAYSVDEDGSITLSQEQLLAQASDLDGDDLTAANLTAGDNATVTANDDGSFTITPDADFNGDIDLSFDLSDGTETVVATADLTVNPVNDIAVVEDVAYTIEEDGSLTFTDEQLLAGASDIDGDELSVADVSYTGAEGVFTDNGDGTYTFAPNENFNGEVSLDFSVSDGTETVDANIDVTVTDVNDAPVAGATSYQMNEDGTITLSPEQLIANSSDVDGEVSLESVTYSGSDGSLVQNDNGSVTFTPSENFNGDISLDVVVTDDDGATATTTAGIEVLAVNDGPESEEVELTTAEDSTILITQDMLLAQATDIDNTADELSASGLQIDPSLGELLDNEDGTWSFTPNENFNGDVPMTFNVSDGQETISVDGNIDVTPVNDAPEAPMIEMQGEEDVVMVIDPAYIADQVTDLDGDEISIESITVRAPANATLTQQPDGMYHLVTTQDFNGLVELGYQATDGEEVVDGSLNVDVIPVNDAPFNVGNAMMTTNEDGAFTFDAGDLMNLFGDIDTADLVVSRIITADGEDGGEVTDNGDGTWTFTPTGDFAGVSDLQVVVSDGEFETVLDVPVYVRPAADGAVISTDHDGPLVFGEDETGHLGLNVGLVDDSETLSNLVMTGFPVGFEVTDGVNTVMITEPGQYIDLFDWDISNIQMTPPEDFHGEFFVTVSATTVDYGDEPEAFEDGIDSGDFETLAGDSIILTADDLIGLAENVDADSDDEVKLVHLADRSQGEIVDNGDGTWTFTPASGFTGEADIAYVIDKDGVLHDEQTGVVVKEGDSRENATPEINSITTTEIAADTTLSFTDEDMLANLSDAEGDSLSIESVSLMEGQGVIESDNQGNYQFTPAEDYTGDVQVGFIATDGENRIESFFNVDIQDAEELALSEGYVLAGDGSLIITESQLVDELGVSDSAQVADVADANDAGFFAESGEGQWTYWPNEDFDGNLAMNVEVNDGSEVSSHSLSIQVADNSAQSDEPPVQAAQVTEEQQLDVVQQTVDQVQDVETEVENSVADVTAAPGDTISISVPDEVSGNESVDYADMSGLPEGATVSNALDNGDGSFTISGNLDQPVSVELPEGYEGTSEVQFQGYDDLGSSIDGASGSVEVEIDDQYTMQGSTQEQQPDMAGMESGGSDWTSSGGQEQGVDFTDDSGSFDSDSQTGTDQGNDLDQSQI
ncbi:polymer-forming cytoskeletal family protein [Vibrio cyclitrophicus 1F289]|uniref:tandem-95 repeat protein n=1 Tax=Vibrio cyclitrophicus TaxID=47951 RepID=UPI0002F7F62E|nr:tandem-95 repeat protein [Vibrio cyclitrophicus]OEF36731.1 polymer-forming cytoskeletal family protein [Vibrio cyclitrophicus 1F289]PMF16568.1 polymer-forming cytoskeletal family protein [Vibrio cyclitrophicus]